MVWGQGPQLEHSKFLSLGARVKSPERPRYLDFTEQSAREKRGTQRENSGNLQRVSLENLAQFWSAHLCEEITWGWERVIGKKIRKKGLGANTGPVLTSPTGKYITLGHWVSYVGSACLGNGDWLALNWPLGSPKKSWKQDMKGRNFSYVTQLHHRTKLMKIFNNTETFNTQWGKTHNDWCPINVTKCEKKRKQEIFPLRINQSS